jgi:hypothetical protein
MSKSKKILTTGRTRSRIDKNFGNLQRLRKNAILDALVVTFPAGNSFTLNDPRVPACFAGDGGGFRLEADLDEESYERPEP